jgi:hypothetical protein
LRIDACFLERDQELAGAGPEIGTGARIEQQCAIGRLDEQWMNGEL